MRTYDSFCLLYNTSSIFICVHVNRKLIYLTTFLALSVSPQAWALHTIKIALVAPFTGPYGAYGTLLLSGAMQASSDINAHGGLKGVKVEIIPIDDQCSADTAVKQAENLTRDKQFHAIIGHVCSGATLATSNIYARANMLVLTPTATNDKITERKINTIFRMTGTDQQQSLVAANFIAKNLKSKRIAILHDQELYSKDLADLVSEHLLHLGTTPILYQGVPRGTRNFTPIIKKLKALDADAIYFAGLYPEVASLAKSLNILQMHLPLITADGATLNKFIDHVGNPKVASSVLMTFAENPSNIVSSQKTINTMQKNNLETTGYSLYAYAAVQVITKAIDNTNTTDGITLANWLHQHEVDTVLGKKSWDTNGNIINAKFAVFVMLGDNNLTTLPSAASRQP